jgi:hypothetical protein
VGAVDAMITRGQVRPKGGVVGRHEKLTPEVGLPAPRSHDGSRRTQSSTPAIRENGGRVLAGELGCLGGPPPARQHLLTP